MNSHVKCFDGLKGLSALIVMMTHFALCFSSISFFQSIPVVGLFFDGGLAVYIFIILSSFGMCCSIANSNLGEAMIKVSLKRYFRLTLPLVCPSILAFAILLSNLDFSNELGLLENNDWTRTLLPETPHLNQLTSGILVGVLKGSALINPLWMMKYIFLGSFIVLPFYALFAKIRDRWLFAMCLFFFFVVFYSLSPYYSASLLGVALFFCKDYIQKLGNGFAIVLFVALIGLHAYDFEKTQFIGGALFIVMTLVSPVLRNVFESRIFVILNKISYQIYLVHASVLACFSSWMYLTFGQSYLMLLLNFILFAIITLLIASLFSKVDTWCNRGMNRIYNLILN